MFIKLRENSTGVYAVNLNTGIRIRIEERLNEFVISVETDTFTTNIESYPTKERAIQTIHHMMDRIQGGLRVCDVSEL